MILLWILYAFLSHAECCSKVLLQYLVLHGKSAYAGMEYK